MSNREAMSVHKDAARAKERCESINHTRDRDRGRRDYWEQPES